MLLAMLIGFIFGFVGSMPVAGPIAMLVLRLGLNEDARHARMVAIGGAVAEGLYSLAAFWGLSSVLDRFPMVVPASRILGILLCLGLGFAMVRHRASEAPPPEAKAKGNKRSLLGGFLITAFNPTFLVTWTAALTALHGFGISVLAPGRAVPFACAAFLGIIAWFTTLLWMVERFKERWSPRAVARVIRVLGILLLAAGAWLGLGTLWHAAGRGGARAAHRPI